MSDRSPSQAPDTPKPGFLQVLQSIGWAMFGVQSSKNRKRDFNHGKAWHYLVVAVGAMLVFIGVITLAVRFALHSAGV